MRDRILISREWILDRPVVSFLMLDLQHDRAAYFTRRGSSVALTDPVVIQHTAATQAVRSFAVLVATGFHVLP